MGASPDERASASSRGASPSSPRAVEPASAASSVGAQRALFPPTTQSSSTASGDPALGDDPIARANAAVAAARETARLRSEEYAKARAEAERYAAAAEALAARDRARSSAEAPDVRASVAERDDHHDHHDHHRHDHPPAPAAPAAASVTGDDAAAASDATTIVAADRLPDVPASDWQRERERERERERGRFLVPNADASSSSNADASSSSSADPHHRRVLLGQHHERKRWSPARGSVDMLRARPAATVSNAAGVLILAEPSDKAPPRKAAVPRFPRKAARPKDIVDVTDGHRRSAHPSGFLALGVDDEEREEEREEDVRRDDVSGARGSTYVNASGVSSFDPSSQPIAFVGVGCFGAPIAARLMDHGFPVVLAPGASPADRRRAATLANHGAASARSPRHAAELLMGKTTTSRLSRAWNPAARATLGTRARGDGPPRRSPLMIFCLPDESAFRDAFDATFPRESAAENVDREMFGACLTVLNLTPLTPKATRRAADRCASVGARYAHAAVRGDAADAEEGTLRLWIAARNANVPGKIAFANGKGVDTSKDAIAHCAAAIEAFAECATRLGDDPATVANDALVEAQMKAERRVVARAKVRMAWRMETLRARLETIEGERAREKTRADVAEARVASFSETVATRESAARESDRREKGARGGDAKSDARSIASRDARISSATLESRVAELEHARAPRRGARAAEEARASAEEARASAERLADESRDEIRDEQYASRRTSTSGRCATPRRRRGSKATADDAARERDVLEEALARCASSEDAATNAPRSRRDVSSRTRRRRGRRKRRRRRRYERVIARRHP